MMKDTASKHLKVQELCDCFATTDPLKEMSELAKGSDEEDAALKWIALACLHGINSDAEKITLKTDGKGVRVTAKYRKKDLPAPPEELGPQIVTAMREMIHAGKDREKTPFALGVRNNSVELQIKAKHEQDSDSITISFP